MLRAKFKADSITRIVGGRNLNMSPVTGCNNEDWSKFTPSGDLRLFVTNEAAFDKIDAIKPGDTFWIDITPIS